MIASGVLPTAESPRVDSGPSAPGAEPAVADRRHSPAGRRCFLHHFPPALEVRFDLPRDPEAAVEPESLS
jgi:hypothetical protein